MAELSLLLLLLLHTTCIFLTKFFGLFVHLLICLFVLVITMNNVNGSVFVMDMNWVLSEMELNYVFK